ncbi:metallophosphoesterase [Blastopirellula marina]|uniref:Metallophosphoesterase n=1 Tax=Blastopirellula marina TaxID=124 RepID=A0A2S8GFU6_9BACT|nr:metallophosphoesterase [Blastopirellula marina]PQO43322.1 metallophosphoesterase [Blastopirellula marina]
MTDLNRRALLQAGLAFPVAAMLGAEASAADPYADAVLRLGPLPELPEGAFTVAVLPDTQNYCEAAPEGFYAQTEWLVEQKEQRNIAAVLHLGDITNRNTKPQWEVAQKAMRQLDGRLPYFFVPGNHDYSAGGVTSDRTSYLDEYFPIAHYRDRPHFGGTYDREPESMLNSYHLFSAGGRDFVVIGLEFGPRKDVVRWANEVAEKHKDREAILITHAYVYYDETRYDWTKLGAKQHWNPHSYPLAKNGDDVSDGEEFWNNLVSQHENFIMTLNGHVLYDGLGRVVSQTPGGRDVHQMLVNFQMKPRGGDGWMRLLEFSPDRKVNVIDYSPTRNELNVSKQNHFGLETAKIG